MKYLFIVLLLHITLSSSQYIVGAYQCNDTIWFAGARADSLGLNTVQFTHWPISMSGSLSGLEAAQRYDLQIILGHATKGKSGRDDLCWYSQLYWGRWEAEDSTNFMWNAGCWRGRLANDIFAKNNAALASYVGDQNPGDILKTNCEHMQQYENFVTYNTVYYLKIDSKSFDTLSQNVPICSLYVTKVNHIPLAGKRLTRKDFLKKNIYQPCTLSYYCPKEENQLYYCLYWYGNSNLLCDYIEAKDLWIDSLINKCYDSILSHITSIYNPYSSLKYYYLLDEPTSSYLASNSYIMRYLKNFATLPFKPGVQCVYLINQNWFRTYVDSVKPEVLLIQYYPFDYKTPQDSGVAFQRKLDSLCYMLDNALRASNQTSSKSIPFWYSSQSFAQYGVNAFNRDPTEREFSCMIWLALAYGAKGIMHFLYRTYEENTWVDSGLTYNGNSRQPLWSVAKKMNFIIKKIGNDLLNLTCDKVFKSNSIPANNCNIFFVSDTLIQVGTFYKTNDLNKKYFIIVNRHCLPKDSLKVLVGINNINSLYLYDCYTKIVIKPTQGSTAPIYWFEISLLPGEGRFFYIINK